MSVLHYRLPVLCDLYTTPGNLVEVEINLVQCTILKIDVEFPAGCCGLVQGRVFVGPRQVIPWNQDAYLSGDDRVISVPIELPLMEPPYVVKVTGFNLDDTYQHTLYIDIDCLVDQASGFEAAVLGQIAGKGVKTHG